MSRISAETILGSVDQKTGYMTEVLSCEEVFYLTYAGNPVLLRVNRNKFTEVDAGVPKYPRNAWNNIGFALNTADKLNKKFETNQFGVCRVIAGEQIV